MSMKYIIDKIRKDFLSNTGDSDENAEEVSSEGTDDILEIVAPEVRNGYLSETFTVKTTKGEYFVKIPPSNQMFGHVAKYFEAYKMEICFYADIGKKLAELDPSVNGFIPTYYDGSSEDNGEYIVLENLVANGFKNQERTKPLRPDQVYTVIKCIAKVHALGYVINKEKSMLESYPGLKPKPFPESSEEFKAPVENFLSFLVDNGVDVTEDEQRSILGWNLNLNESEQRSMKVEEGDIVAFLHRDLWNNNFMFRPKSSRPACTAEENNNTPAEDTEDEELEEEVDDVKIVDWQVPRVGPIGVDLIYFIFNCVSQEMVVGELDQILGHYHKWFVRTLRKTSPKTEPPTLDSIRSNLERKVQFGFFLAITVLPLMIELIKQEMPTSPKTDSENAIKQEPEKSTKEDDMAEMGKAMSAKYDEARLGSGRRERMIGVYHIAKTLGAFSNLHRE